MVTHTAIVKPLSTFHAGCGKAGEVEVHPAGRTVWVLGKRQGIHFIKQITSFMRAGHSREKYGGCQGWSGGTTLLRGGGVVASAGHGHGYGGLGRAGVVDIARLTEASWGRLGVVG